MFTQQISNKLCNLRYNEWSHKSFNSPLTKSTKWVGPKIPRTVREPAGICVRPASDTM